MLPDDATLAELYAAWPSLVEDMEHAHVMPQHVAEQVVADFTLIHDELLTRQHRARQAHELCAGHDGDPQPHPPTRRRADFLSATAGMRALGR